MRNMGASVALHLESRQAKSSPYRIDLQNPKFMFNLCFHKDDKDESATLNHEW